VDHTFSGIGGLWAAAKAAFSGSYTDADALQMLNEPVRPVHSFNPLVQIETSKTEMEESRA
jgi:hypothetical protein